MSLPRGGATSTAPACRSLLKMSFEKPQRLIESAREGGEEIRGVGIAGAVGFVDRRSHRARDLGIPLDQRGEMVIRRIDLGRVGSKRGAVGDRLGGAKRGSAELNSAFCDRVYVIVEFGPKPVDHLVQRDELRPLDVPVRLLGQER